MNDSVHIFLILGFNTIRILIPLFIYFLTVGGEILEFKTKEQELVHNLASQALLQLATTQQAFFKAFVQGIKANSRANLENALKRILSTPKISTANWSSGQNAGIQAATPKIQLKNFANF